MLYACVCLYAGCLKICCIKFKRRLITLKWTTFTQESLWNRWVITYISKFFFWHGPITWFLSMNHQGNCVKNFHCIRYTSCRKSLYYCHLKYLQNSVYLQKYLTLDILTSLEKYVGHWHSINAHKGTDEEDREFKL